MFIKTHISAGIHRSIEKYDKVQDLLKEFDDQFFKSMKSLASTLITQDLLNAFPLTLKDKAKFWLNSLRPRTIRNWAELQAEFLKKFFSTTKTNSLKRQIYTYSAYDNEKFYQCWERFMETISACPHHGFDTWMLVNHFYDGMSPAMKQLLETMCGGDFLSKNPDEAMDFLNYVAETSKGWDEPNPREAERMRPSSHQRGGIYALSEDTEMKAKLTTLTKRLEELEMRNKHEMLFAFFYID